MLPMTRAAEHFETPRPPTLRQEDRRELARIARDALRAWIERQEKPPVDVPASGVLAEPHGVFVTLRTGGELRGCIGTGRPSSPLVLGVAEYARAAASRDPRFPRLRSEELEELEVEISVLSGLRPLPADPQAVLRFCQPGVHGISLALGNRRGLLLPQVADHWGMDAESFLNGVAEKAGARSDAWRDPAARLEVFTVTSFSAPAPPALPPRSAAAGPAAP